VGLLGAVFISFSLAYTSIEHGHIAVDFLIRRFRQPVQRSFEGVTSFVCTGLFGLATWQSFLYASHIRKTGEVSLTLQVPLYPFVYGMAVGCGLLCIVLLFRFVQWLAQR
jgi:TRAP-type C4-dicarboxylate transport system permease small subunit